MRILALSPHTDDVELGCGGTLARLAEEGHEIHWAVFSSARESVPADLPPDVLLREQRQSAKVLGLEDRLDVLDLPVRRFDEHRQAVLEKLVALRSALAPDLVLAPSAHDVHQDHGVIAAEATRAFKSAARLAGYELPWNQLRSEPGLFVRLERRHVDRKLAMLACYASQVVKGRAYFSEDYIVGVCRTRGVQCGAEYAEALDVVRWIL